MNKKLIPLYILNEGGKVPITPLMKLVFLVQKEKIEEEPYEYTPERYGPFSKVLFDDIQRLLNEGFIKIIEEESKIFPDPIEYYTLTKRGEKH